MLLFFVFLSPFLFFLIATYLFNRNKLDESHSKIIVISCLEALFAYLLTLIIVYEGFFNAFWLFVLLFLFTLIVGIILFYQQQALDQDWDLQIETIKNTLTLYFMTFVPFMVALSIFRYYTLFMQLLFSLLLTIVIFIIGWLVKRIMASSYNRLFYKIANAQVMFYIGVWIVFGFFLLVWILFGFPKATLSKPLNLSDNIGYLTFDGFDSTMQNNVKPHTIFKLSTDNLPYSNDPFIDYITDDDYLYLLRSDGRMYIVSLSSGRVRYNRQIINQETILRPKSAEAFFKSDDNIYLLTALGLHHITPTSHTLIDDTILSGNTDLIKSKPDVLLLHKDEHLNYTLLKIENHSTEMVASFDTLDESLCLVVISNHIFIDDTSHYQLWDDATIRFEIKAGIPSYLASEQTMVYVDSQLDATSMVQGTLYTALDNDEQTTTKNLPHIFNRHSVVVGNMIYFIPEFDKDLGRVEAMDNLIEFAAIHRHHAAERLWFLNAFDDSYVVSYKQQDNRLLYLQIDHKDEQALLSLIALTNEDLALPLPFYSHYGLGIFVPIIIAMFIPISNYREHITILDFKSALKKK